MDLEAFRARNKAATDVIGDKALRDFGKGIFKGVLHPEARAASRAEDARIQAMGSKCA